MAHNAVPPEERGVVSSDTTPRYTLAELVDMLQRLAAEDERRRASVAPPSGPNSLRRESRGSGRADSSVSDPGDRRYWDNVSPDSSFLNAHLPSILPDPSLVPGARRQERPYDEREEDRAEQVSNSNSGTYYSSRASNPDDADDSAFTSAPPSASSARYGPSSSNPYRALCPTAALLAMPRAPSTTISARATSANNPAYTPSRSNPPAIIASSAMARNFISFPDPPSPVSPSAHVDAKGKARASSSAPLRSTRLSISGTRPEPGAPLSASRPFVTAPTRLSAVSTSAPAPAEAPPHAAPACAPTPVPAPAPAPTPTPVLTPFFAEESESPNWYAVIKGRQVGVFDNNLVAVASVGRISGFAMKQYGTRAEAMKAYLQAEQLGLVSQVQS
ncbi:hypothetical protein TRAPUB_1321 [Trametes pubescens]|uniref:Ribonuclease H1 N-terminal domain-containing protein n=1 Tax=Trametes pubescens TaxID=154538 RepID=A0A1M2VJS3_TRAPU|nr:hypothetical protein TRAPUB_1321 [Trametes pubescens]